jgi:hypothetical protein
LLAHIGTPAKRRDLKAFHASAVLPEGIAYLKRQLAGGA